MSNGSKRYIDGNKRYIVHRCREGELERFLNSIPDEYEVLAVAHKRDWIGLRGWTVVAGLKEEDCNVATNNLGRNDLGSKSSN